MICRTLSLVLLFVLGNLARSDTFVYISVAAEKRIAVFLLDSATGKLTHRSDCQVADGEPGALTVDPEKRFLLAAIRSTGKLASFRLDAATGKLTHINTVTVGPDPAHISTDRTGRYLLTAYYVAGEVTVHAIGKDGALSEKPLQSIPTADKAHAIVPDPSNRFVFVPHTGPNAIFQFTFDARAGKLSANDPAKLTTPQGTGPRHLVFHPSKPIAYVANEQGGSVTAYALDPKAGTTVKLTLDKAYVERVPNESKTHKYLSLPSKLLSEFHGRPMVYRVGVVLPPNFDAEPEKKYALLVRIGGFGQRYTSAARIRPDPRFVHLFDAPTGKKLNA